MSLPLLSALLLMPSRALSTRTELEAAIAKINTKDSIAGVESIFAVEVLDLTKLSTEVVPAFTDAMRQELDHGCMLNAARFVLQLKLNVMVGNVASHLATAPAARNTLENGDRVLFSLLYESGTSKVTKEAFAGRYDRYYRARNLAAAHRILNSLGITTSEPELTTSLTAYISLVQGHGGRGILVVAGFENGVDHTYVLYDFQTRAGQLEAKIYNPWTGTLMSGIFPSPNDRMDVQEFESNFAMAVSALDTHMLALDSNGDPLPGPDDDGKMFLRPGMPIHPTQTVKFAVLFVPM
jgi:hypothetical protein